MKLKLKVRINRPDARTIRHALEQLSAKGSVRKAGDEFDRDTAPYAKGLLITSPGPLIGKNGILARDGIRNSTQRCAAGQDRSAESRDDRPGRGPLAGRPRRGVVASLHRNAGVFAVATWQGGERPELRQGELLRR